MSLADRADILPPSLIDLVEDTVAETLDAHNEEVDLELEDDDTCFEEWIEKCNQQYIADNDTLLQ